MSVFDDPAFVNDHWLPRRPAHLAARIDPELIGLLAEPTALPLACHGPVEVDRYIGPQEDDRSDRTRLPAASQIGPLCRRSIATASPHIYYAFNLQETWPAYGRLVADYGPETPYAWRRYSDLVSWSCPGSTIHAHVDLLDALIIQIDGRRRWEIWPEHGDPDYLRSMNRNLAVPSLGRPPGEPLVYDLEPGDILSIPAMWPHAAATDPIGPAAVSVSIGWTSLTRARLVHALIGPAAWEHALPRLAEPGTGLWEVLPDPPPETAPSPWLAERLGADCLDAIAVQHPDLDPVAAIDALELGDLGRSRLVTRGDDLPLFAEGVAHGDG